MKLRKLHIDDYKMFKDFDISFVDENDEALPIIVLAGVNGSGKTSLLDWIYNFINLNPMSNKNFIEITDKIIAFGRKFLSDNYYDNAYIKNTGESIEDNHYLYRDNIIYFLSGTDDTKKVAEEFVNTFYFFLKEKDYRPSEITEHFHNYMKDIFNDLDIGFKYSHLDKEDNVWFVSSKEENEYFYTANNSNHKKIFTINELSTGEKTLLSKVLYLFFQDYKDKVILIDEPELSLHPSWQNKVLKIYENFAIKNNCQIIIATHSPHIIGSAKNEYLRILRKKEDGRIEVISDLKAHGRDINSILFDVMDEVAYRPKEFQYIIDKLHIEIDNKNFEEAKRQLDSLKKSYGEDDDVILEAKMLIDVLSNEE